MAGQEAAWTDGAAASAPGEARVAAGLTAVAASGWRASLLLVLLCAALFLPGVFQIPGVDRDETRFVQTSKQMVESGDYVDLHFHTVSRYKKPVGIYWLQSAATLVTGYGADAPIWVYRLVSLIGMTIAVLLTFHLGRRLVGPEAALAGAALLAACVIVNVEARLAKTDAALLATVMAAQFALARLYAKGGRLAGEAREAFFGWPLLFWVGIGAGVLIKGPITPMVSGLTILTLAVADRRAGWLGRLRWLPGILVAAAMVVPWLVAINHVSQGRFLQEALGHDMLGKVAEGQETHGAPPGLHFLLFWVIFWPGAALVAASVPAIWRSRREHATRFLLAWIIPAFLVFEIVVTKLPHYTMPTYPAIALLAGAALTSGRACDDRSWARLFMMASAVGGILVAIGATGALVYLEGVWSPLAILLALVVLAIGFMAARAAAHGLFRSTAALLVVEALLVYATVFGTVAPQLRSVWVAPRIAAAVKAAAQCEHPQVLAAGYNEASLIFAIGTDIRFGDGKAAADFLAADGCHVAIVTERQFEPFVARAKALGYNPQIHETLSGINIGNSRWLTFQIATRPE